MTPLLARRRAAVGSICDVGTALGRVLINGEFPRNIGCRATLTGITGSGPMQALVPERPVALPPVFNQERGHAGSFLIIE